MSNELILTRDNIDCLIKNRYLEFDFDGKPLKISMAKEEILITLHVPMNYRKSKDLQIQDLDYTIRDAVNQYNIPCTDIDIRSMDM